MDSITLVVGEAPLAVAVLTQAGVRALAHPLLALLLDPPPLLVVTDSGDGRTTLICDFEAAGAGGLRDALREKEHGCALSESRWRAVKVLDVDLGTVTAVSGALARDGCSILYISTNDADYVLVRERELRRALRCLGRSFRVDLEVDGGGDVLRSPAASPAPAPAKAPAPDAPAAPDDGADAGGSSSDDAPGERAEPEAPQLTMAQVPGDVALFNIPADRREEYTRRLLRVIFFADEARPFFSFVHARDEGDLVIADRQSLAVLDPGGNTDALEAYRAWRIEGDLGFDETGIVLAVSSLLSGAGIPLAYSSVFFTDIVLVQESRNDEARELLRLIGGGAPE